VDYADGGAAMIDNILAVVGVLALLAALGCLLQSFMHF
jgi:hypothetical protein